eukprot:1873437-Amphidinium_carterae.1
MASSRVNPMEGQQEFQPPLERDSFKIVMTMIGHAHFPNRTPHLQNVVPSLFQVVFMFFGIRCSIEAVQVDLSYG